MGATGGECTGRKTQATSWTRWLVQCSQCFCYCDEPGLHSDRYFSLRPVLSDVTKNKCALCAVYTANLDSNATLPPHI